MPEQYSLWSEPVKEPPRYRRGSAIPYETKPCAQCGKPILRNTNNPESWAAKHYCSNDCQAKAQSKPGRRQDRWRDKTYDWASWWERSRAREDKRDLREQARLRRRYAKLSCLLTPRAVRNRQPRHFLGWYCKACGEAYIFWTSKPQAPYCMACNTAHHRRPANRRAKQRGVAYEVVVPERVFERDNWTCQLCGEPVSGVVPEDSAPTIDHIVPLAKNGPHTYSNVQCAHFLCNCLKRDVLISA